MMRRKILLPLLGAGMLVCLATSASAQGVLDNQQTFFTFSAPVALPGVTLPAGKYEFRLAGSQVNRQIVQVFNSDRRIVATIFSVPATRADIPDNPEVRFLEVAANNPPAIKTWWYPGSKSSGHEFIYPKAEAQKYAALNTGVLSAEEPRAGDLERLSASSTERFESETREQAMTGTPTRGEVSMTTTTTTVGSAGPSQSSTAVVQQTRPAPSTSMSQDARTSLPRTAGTRSVIVLFGLVALAVGLWAAAGRYGFGH